MKHPDGIEVYLKPTRPYEWMFDFLWDTDQENSEHDTDEFSSDDGNDDNEELNLEGLSEEEVQKVRADRKSSKKRQKKIDASWEREYQKRESRKQKIEEDKKIRDAVKYPELKIDDDDPLRKRCFVPAYWGTFEVVVRFSEDFDMYSADSVQIGTFNGTAERRTCTARTEQRSRLLGQQFSIYQALEDGLRFPIPLKMKAHEGPFEHAEGTVLRGPIAQAADGTILVCITRGMGAWRRKSPGDPSDWRPCFNGPFKPLEGEKGHSYVFEFCPRSQPDMVAEEKRLRSEQPASNDRMSRRQAVRFTGINDPDYVDARSRTESVRREMFRAWKKKNAWRRGISRSQTTPKLGRSNRRQYGPTIYRSKTPPICSCPVDHGKSPAASKTGPKRPAQKGKKASQTENINDDEAEDASHEGESRSISTKQAKNATKETLARTCSRCKKYKRAPRGKKITYRERTGKYMYVHKDAPEEDDPAAEEDEDDQGEGEDQDGVDEEPLPETKPETNGGDADGSDPEAIDTANADENGDGMIITETEPGDFIPTIDDAATGETETETSIAGAEDQHEDPGTVAENAQSSNEIEASRDNDSQSLFVEETDNTTEDIVEAETTSAAADQPSTPPETPSTEPADAESKKRPSDSELEAPAPKKARVDVDLTMDDDDDLVVVKSEPLNTAKRKISVHEDNEDLEHKLEQLRRRKQILEIEVEEAEIKRKLAKSRGQGMGMAKVKEEAVIKIED